MSEEGKDGTSERERKGVGGKGDIFCKHKPTKRNH